MAHYIHPLLKSKMFRCINAATRFNTLYEKVYFLGENNLKFVSISMAFVLNVLKAIVCDIGKTWFFERKFFQDYGFEIVFK